MSPWPWVESLGRASLEGAVLIVAVWAACRTWPALPAWTRGMLWWLACARLLLGLLPLAPVTVPLVPAATATWWPSAVAGTEPTAVVAIDSKIAADAGLTRSVASPARPGRSVPRSPWTEFDPRLLGYGVLAAWLLGAGVRAAGHVLHSVRLRRACRESVALSDERLEPLRPILPDFVRVASSAAAPAPLVTGLFRPLVLLPASMFERPLEDLRLAVAHEVGHVRRLDLWLAWVPALAETLFWFHPLLPLCVREYLQACEEACDARALNTTGAAPYEYGRLLLALGVQRKLGGATAIPCGSPHPRQLTRRLSMLHDLAPLGPHARRAAVGLIAGFALVGLAPLRIVPTQAISAAPNAGVADAVSASAPALPITIADLSTSPSATPDAETPSSDAPRTPDLGSIEGPEDVADAKEPGEGLQEPLGPPAPQVAHDPDEDPDPDPDADPDPELTPPVPPTPPEPPSTPEAEYDDEDWDGDEEKAYEKKHEKKYEYRARKARAATPAPSALRTKAARPAKAPRARGYGYSWDDHKGDAFAYVIVNQESEATSGSGRTDDFQEARRLKRELDTDFIWVRNGRDRYVIEDPDWVERAQALLAPMQEIGSRQSRIGRMQSRIGHGQSQIGQQQSRIGAQQSEIGARQGQIARRMAERQRSGRPIDDLEQAMEDLSADMERLSRGIEDLSEQMEPLTRQQEALGAQQEALAREMEQASRENMRELRALLDDAIRRGVARRLR